MDCNTLIFTLYIMRSVSEFVKDWFRAQFILVLTWGSESIKVNDKNAELFVTCKHCQAITDSEKKVVKGYYFDLTNEKLEHKYIQEWFLHEFQYFPSQSTILKSLSTTVANLDIGSIEPRIKKQSNAK